MSDNIQNPNQQQTPMQQQLAQLPATQPATVTITGDSFTPTATAVCDDTAMRFTQTVRTHVVQNMMQSGALSGNDIKQTALMVGILKDMDSQALGNKRIKADEKAAGALGDASSLVLQVLNAVDPRTFGVYQGTAPINPAAREVQQDPSATAVPGEMDVNPGQLNYNDFITAQRGLPPQQQ